MSASPPSSSSPAAGRRVTIMDIARHVGMSRSATAYALRDDPHTSQATRARVKAAAKALGYRRDPLISQLMAHVHRGSAHSYLGKIAFLNPDPKRDFAQTTPALRDFFQDAKERALALGYETEVFWLHEPGRTPRQLARILLARGIRGLVIGDMESRSALPDFPWSNFSVIAVGNSIISPPLPRVVPHHYKNTLIAIERVLAAGYRRPGLLTYHRQEDAMARLHVAAFMAFQSDLPPEGRVPLLDTTEMHGAGIRAWFDAEKPDVILTTNFPADIHFNAAGLRVPRDVALVSLLRWNEEAGIAGIRPGFERLGAVAVNQLVSRLQHNERGIPDACTTIELEGRWTSGRSMPDPARWMRARGTTKPARKKTRRTAT